MSDHNKGDDNQDGSSSGATTEENPSNNPLFGAPPPSEEVDNNTKAPSSSSAPLQPRVGPQAVLEAEAEAGPSTSTTLKGTTNPLYGATPPQDALPPWRLSPYSNANESSQTYGYGDGYGYGYGYDLSQPRELRVYHPPIQETPSKTIIFIKRITYLLSIFLGMSATFAGIWSIFVLPLLHSTFSARKALVSQQTDRMGDILERLRRLRAIGMYGQPRSMEPDQKYGNGVEGMAEGKHMKESHEDENGSQNDDDDDDEDDDSGIRREASLKEISESVELLHLQSDHRRRQQEQENKRRAGIDEAEAEEVEIEIVPTTSLSLLSTKLNDLSGAMESTSTTRISLISTLESYTSSIHRQLFVSRSLQGGYGGYSVGMNSLNQHLNNRGNSSGSKSTSGGVGGLVDDLGGVNPEEWDKTRKEIRAIKGLLLNRRQFAQAH
ncbi:uncharacterized protein I303_106999 [Kwoniella dejecticola CBS 10117]|uniref:Uncharacterized protein n=1 Tax=Kwoniella dejecticola CBS 10117 TaxID=1296121 RepID=A0A1A5ZYH2_9TREE|nr:uncharacterized protein I303_06400 [Kwoniella dejecticola CBS 10117]OBR82843.1 hypothetical protein I303_06400 [Kwoniella dejecticola CBS 10117]